MLEHKKQWSIITMSRVLQVTPSGYHSWVNKRSINSKTALLDVLVKAEFIGAKKRYGYRRITKALELKGYHFNKKTIQCSMQRQQLVAIGKKKFRVTTDSNHKLRIYPNILKRDFYAETPNQKWVGDITYIWTKKGWTYLASIVDLCTHKVVGWAMSENIDSDLACNALRDALIREQYPKGVIMHTDRGSTYCSDEYRQLLKDYHCKGSMSRKGDCWDNAVAESFFGILKREIEGLNNYFDQQSAYDAVFEFIECWYNSKRLHSTIGYKSPLSYEKELLLSK